MRSYTQRIIELAHESLKPTGQPMDESQLEAIKEHACNPVRQAQALRRILEQAHESLKKQRRVDPSNPTLQRLFIGVSQHLAQSYYKDPNLSVSYKLGRAMKILNQALALLRAEANPATAEHVITLALAGSVYKREWQYAGTKQSLEMALAYYQGGQILGMRRWTELPSDNATPEAVAARQRAVGAWGYPAVNAAFALSVLADLEVRQAEQAGFDSPVAADRRKVAREIWQKIVEEMPPVAVESSTPLAGKSEEEEEEELHQRWWAIVTLAEACFGLREYDNAYKWLKQAKQIQDKEEVVSDIQLESVIRQFSHLASVLAKQDECGQPAPQHPAWQALQKVFGLSIGALESLHRGKIGLALSGGGLRAALFHIGVLARLAELDVLRAVEVISCVSGGSIIGAYYYLKVRNLLQTTPDDQIEPDHYRRIVREIESEFLACAQKNIRTQVLLNPWKNLRIFFDPRYSRTKRLGELYETQLFSRIEDDLHGKTRNLKDLVVNPKGSTEDEFHPPSHNWKRQAKVPVLILNAASLNTGHNWQFTVRYMGEPPAAVERSVDAVYRLRRVYFYDPGARQISLGEAVAASSCVPGLFSPLKLQNLYQKKTVRLVDGGVHDNQGTASLLEQDCALILISDASGQLNGADAPKSFFPSVLQRSNDILMERVRLAQYKELAALHQASRLKGLMYVHLRKDLDIESISSINNQEEAPAVVPKRTRTSYGVHKKIQHQLSCIRTDLDSFSEAEACALMVSGYHMTKEEFGASIQGFSNGEQVEQWDFLQKFATPLNLDQDDELKSLLRLLKVANARAFKVWKLAPLQCCALGLGLLAVLALLALFGLSLAPQLWAFIGQTLLSVLILLIILGLGLAFGVALLAWLHLRLFDRLYLKLGKADRLFPVSKA